MKAILRESPVSFDEKVTNLKEMVFMVRNPLFVTPGIQVCHIHMQGGKKERGFFKCERWRLNFENPRENLDCSGERGFSSPPPPPGKESPDFL